MLPPGTLQNINNVLMASVLHGSCYVYTACNFNSQHDGAGQYVDVLFVSVVLILCVKWLGCCDYGYLTGICVKNLNNEHNAEESSSHSITQGILRFSLNLKVHIVFTSYQDLSVF
jgi:hypothetical protein